MEPHEQITVFAKTNFRGKEVPFGIKTDDRRRHMYVIGKTGMGKTSLMEGMVIQDIRAGHGVAFLDPHGDSVQHILDSIPPSRINDVVYFNPADLDYPIAFNILEAVDTKYKHLVASGLMGVFTKIWANLWSARMEYILNNTILALLDSPGNTMLGITRMYVDKKYRKRIVDNVKDPMVRAFWVDEFANYQEKYRTEAVAPIQNKVGQFLSSAIIRNIVGQPKSTIDLREIMDNRKILIMDLSKGRVGEDNAALLGAMLVTKMQLAAMSRTDIEERDRKDFYLYVDEFQNFATDSFATILSEARKYRLNLIVGHQYIAQLEQDRSTKVRDAIFGNVGTMVFFRVGAADAEFLETEIAPTFLPVDLVNLPKYNILLRLMINGVASEPFTAVTLPPNPTFITDSREKVTKVSRERYGRAVAEVEDRIERWMGEESSERSAQIIVGSAPAAPEREVAGEEPVWEPAAAANVATVSAEAAPQPAQAYEPAPVAEAPSAAPLRAHLAETPSRGEPSLSFTAQPLTVQAEAPRAVTERVTAVPRVQQQPPRDTQSQPRRDDRPRHQGGGGGNRFGGRPGGGRFQRGGSFRDRRPGQGTGSNFRDRSNDRGPRKPKDKPENPIWNIVAELSKNTKPREQGERTVLAPGERHHVDQD